MRRISFDFVIGPLSHGRPPHESSMRSRRNGDLPDRPWARHDRSPAASGVPQSAFPILRHEGRIERV